MKGSKSLGGMEDAYSVFPCFLATGIVPDLKLSMHGTPAGTTRGSAGTGLVGAGPVCSRPTHFFIFADSRAELPLLWLALQDRHECENGRGPPGLFSYSF